MVVKVEWVWLGASSDVTGASLYSNEDFIVRLMALQLHLDLSADKLLFFHF